MNRKAQSQIITTVLIILLVLAAIVIVWQVVQGTVRSGAEQIPGQTDCLTIDLEMVTPLTAGGAITVHRGVGQGDLAGVRVFENNVAVTPDYPLTVDESANQAVPTYALPTAQGSHNIKIAKLVGTSLQTAKLCGFDRLSVDGIDLVIP